MCILSAQALWGREQREALMLKHLNSAAKDCQSGMAQDVQQRKRGSEQK